MSKIKICGLRRLLDIQAVNEYKPDYVGFIFAKSKRQITQDLAMELKMALHKDIKAVGVFVNEPKENIARICENGIIDIVQLHGQETEAEIIWLKKNTGKPVIKAVSVKTEKDIEDWDKSSVDYLLLDNGSGGTGKTFDWNNIKEIKHPYFFAGGINSDNVEEALKYEPYAIDVSGGVETDGYKDAEKIKTIIDKVRRIKCQ